MEKLSIRSVGHATSLFLAITYLVCLLFDFMFSEMAMYTVWEKLLPGFRFSGIGLLIGLLESYSYGWYFALIWVPLYNKFK